MWGVICGSQVLRHLNYIHQNGFAKTTFVAHSPKVCPANFTRYMVVGSVHTYVFQVGHT